MLDQLKNEPKNIQFNNVLRTVMRIMTLCQQHSRMAKWECLSTYPKIYKVRMGRNFI